MSVYTNQTNLTPGTSAYITRAEVGLALSTIVGDISGVDWNNLLYNPNPKFSTVMMNASGLISGASGLEVNNSISVSTATLKYVNPTTGIQFAITDPFGNYTSIGTGGIYAQAGSATGSAFKVKITPSQIFGETAAGVQQLLANYNPGALSNQWLLNNVSTINGIPPNTAGTTFTTLTGSNLTTTGTLTSPQIVNVSSINGAAYATSVQATFTGSNSTAVPSGAATTAFSIAVPPGVFKVNEAFVYDVPIVLGAFPPSPINFQLMMGIRLGGNGQINYSMPYWIAANSVNPIPLNLTGIANTNQTALLNNNIDIVVVQNSGSTWTAPFYAPPSAGAVNTWTLKLLD